jgi:uncharacterized protein YbaR (Trm112 family)
MNPLRYNAFAYLVYFMMRQHVCRVGEPKGAVMDKKLLDILVCPVCKGPLVYRKNANELICKGDRLAYPILDDIPIMLEEEARELPAEEEVP